MVWLNHMLCHAIWSDQSTCYISVLHRWFVYSHMLIISWHVTLMAKSASWTTRSSMRRMCTMCCCDSRNSAPIAKLRSVNSEYWKPTSGCLLSFPTQSAWNCTTCSQVWTGQHWSHLEQFRYSSDGWPSINSSSGYVQPWLIHLLNFERR